MIRLLTTLTVMVLVAALFAAVSRHTQQLAIEVRVAPSSMASPARVIPLRVDTPPHRTRAHPRRVTLPSAWKALARCESGLNPKAVDPSGRYFGWFQFDRGTWASVGGHGLPSNASPAAQYRRARALFRERGSQPWPICGRYL